MGLPVPWILMGLLVVAGIAVALTWLSLAAGKSLRLALIGTGLAAVGSSVGLALGRRILSSPARSRP